jgi:hypothetical protein
LSHEAGLCAPLTGEAVKIEFFERQALDFRDERPLLCFGYQFGAVMKALRQPWLWFEQAQLS